MIILLTIHIRFHDAIQYEDISLDIHIVIVYYCVYMIPSPTTRINISLSEDVLAMLKRYVPERGLSRFLTEAANEKITRIKRENALKNLLAAPPSLLSLAMHVPTSAAFAGMTKTTEKTRRMKTFLIDSDVLADFFRNDSMPTTHRKTHSRRKSDYLAAHCFRTSRRMDEASSRVFLPQLYDLTKPLG